MSMTDDDQGAIDTGDDNSGAAPVMSSSPGLPAQSPPVNDDAGGVDAAAQQQAQQPQRPDSPFDVTKVPGNAKRIIAYLMGADAAPPQTLDQYGQHIDPEGRMSPADRNILAIHAAREQGGDNAAWQLMQANRVAYNAQTAFAKTALQGTQQKPADIHAAVDAANKAQSNVLDGSNIQFAASHGGVTATVTMPGSSQPQTMMLSPQQFSQFLDVGGDGQWDKIMEHSAPATLQRLASSGGAQPSRGMTRLDQMKPLPKAAPAAQQQQPGDQGDEDTQQASAPPSDAVRSGRPIARDVTEGDQPAIPGTHDANGHHIGPEAPDRSNYGDELEARSRQIFMGVSQEPERQQWMAQQEEKELERGNKIDVAAETGKRRLEVARATGQSRENVADINSKAKLQGWQYASDAKLKVAQSQLAAKITQQENTNANAAQTRELKMIQTKLMTAKELTPQEQAIVDTMPGAAQAGAQVTAPQQRQQAPQPQQNTQRPPVQGAKLYKGQWYTRGPNGESVPVHQ